MKVRYIIFVAILAPGLLMSSEGVGGAGALLGGGSIIKVEKEPSVDYKGDRSGPFNCRMEWGLPGLPQGLADGHTPQLIDAGPFCPSDGQGGHNEQSSPVGI